MLKDYHKYKKVFIGESDIATLVLAGYVEGEGLQLEKLDFGGDGEYRAYIVDEEATAGSHYELVHTFNAWLKIYDDFQLVREFKADTINIYRAGDFGCIVQLIGAK